MADTILVAESPQERLLRQRLTALLLTLPDRTRNFTAVMDDAKWLIREATAIGWVLTIDDQKGPTDG